MILADKIIDERKKNGWSQEELADKLGVSRQSVSKWEGAQSVPDLQRILEMSKLFGVSTDYLLKDDEDRSVIEDKEDSSLRKLSMEEANTFLSFNNTFAGKIALGAALCTLCSAPLLFFIALQRSGALPLTEQAASGIGITLLLILVCVSLVFFIPAGISYDRWDWLTKESFDSEYGVEGMVKTRAEKFLPRFISSITFGTITIMAGVIAIILGSVFGGNNEALTTGLVGIFLCCCAIGVYFIVRAGIIKDGMDKLLQEGEYRIEEKENTAMKVVAPVYWLTATGGYLAWSFLGGAWNISWMVWPIAGIVFAIISTILRATEKK